jgi:redox-sensitive bicupin YhaK (pirin superfamily)
MTEPLTRSTGLTLPNPVVERVIGPKEHDLGGFTVRRSLPVVGRRMVGPFVFFDHIGPAVFGPGHGVDVRPHPHIGLSTITWLFDGGMEHRDSLGYDLEIRPGALNWMTAGRGIVHSERTGAAMRAAGHRLHGIQSWVALPDTHEDTDPAFDHYEPEALPVIERDGVRLVLIAGSEFGETSKARTHSPLFYLQADMQAGARLVLPASWGERAFYIVEGEAAAGGEAFGSHAMVVLNDGVEAEVEARRESRLMLLGGAPVGKRTIWWNLVASDHDRIESAKRGWIEAAASGFPPDGRFTLPPGETEHIPLPET